MPHVMSATRPPRVPVRPFGRLAPRVVRLASWRPPTQRPPTPHWLKKFARPSALL
ncbi:hypothetical protein CABS01_12839 [Colletotrichum abscissum]|uniref:Uncharacterized protein n=1 Tax=Colletotrichum tamarilloi TaxID=1209934 RepID=A0ABQ9RBR3_9PEZI|nr:uncharacterized protein CTAM01_06569 [Colletotrichum tamarilloi]XP_060395580.1 uncharacterized protein CABS01_12839 [Colletotrichum abscissum]KAK1487964.1 hypothetical protein CABS01_12839 [Colletotrichum abscissum]KAK1500634.1 hypothetical protein CTAM01_06569 [Colletotrichum tamarilloi]